MGARLEDDPENMIASPALGFTSFEGQTELNAEIVADAFAVSSALCVLAPGLSGLACHAPVGRQMLLRHRLHTVCQSIGGLSSHASADAATTTTCCPPKGQWFLRRCFPRPSLDGASLPALSCWRCSAGASASTARRSISTPCRRRVSWSVALVSSAVTAALPGRRRRRRQPAGALPAVRLAGGDQGGAIALALGVLGWAMAREPWQLLLATLLSGAGWVAMGAAAVNAIIAPWFVQQTAGGAGHGL